MFSAKRLSFGEILPKRYSAFPSHFRVSLLRSISRSRLIHFTSILISSKRRRSVRSSLRYLVHPFVVDIHFDHGLDAVTLTPQFFGAFSSLNHHHYIFYLGSGGFQSAQSGH